MSSDSTYDCMLFVNSDGERAAPKGSRGTVNINTLYLYMYDVKSFLHEACCRMESNVKQSSKTE